MKNIEIKICNGGHGDLLPVVTIIKAKALHISTEDRILMIKSTFLPNNYTANQKRRNTL